ncbi:MAG: GatB/YqeY domain-containing protein, partial [Gammaproteobacteria bacterium]|nr:GatB/YqeY domain-containing protein [Gammaproteobacteria bacterium]
AMKAGEKDKLGVIRMVSAAIKQIEVDERKELNDAEVLAVLDKMAKQRRESIKQFREGGREDLAAVEEAEITVLQTWLPEQLSDAEIDALVAEAISATGAEGMKDMGKVMGMLKPKLQGRADMGAVSGKIKAQLN